jgi:hypothetical protein
MKMLFSIGGSLALSALLLTAQAQTPATTHDNPTPAKLLKTADQRASTYQGPKVTKDSKALGKKMVQKSKPADMRMRVPVQKVK